MARKKKSKYMKVVEGAMVGDVFVKRGDTVRVKGICEPYSYHDATFEIEDTCKVRNIDYGALVLDYKRRGYDHGVVFLKNIESIEIVEETV